MGVACSMHGINEKIYKILFIKHEENDYLGKLVVDGRIILEWIISTRK
jgi:hypothetical protein